MPLEAVLSFELDEVAKGKIEFLRLRRPAELAAQSVHLIVDVGITGHVETAVVADLPLAVAREPKKVSPGVRSNPLFEVWKS